MNAETGLLLSAIDRRCWITRREPRRDQRNRTKIMILQYIVLFVILIVRGG
jgi:hypothetical protein